MSFRNQQQKEAFDQWWQGYMKQYFPDHAKKCEGVDGNTVAMFCIKAAYRAGIAEMAQRIQGALSFETTTSVRPKS